MTLMDVSIPVYHAPSIGIEGQGYNLGDILNMPVFWAGWSPFRSRANLSVVAMQLPASIVGRYYNCRTNGLGAVADDPLIPHRPRLLCATDEYLNAHPEIAPMLQVLQDDSVLCVHVRSGDYGPVDPTFLRTIEMLSKQYAKIIVMSGVHYNGPDRLIAQNVATLKHTLSHIRDIVPHAVFDFNHPDVHICYMAKAHNLLVHMGGFSITGTLVFSGKQLYITPSFQPLSNKRWRELRIPHQLVNPVQLTVEPAIRRVPHQLVNPVQPTVEPAIRRVPHQLVNPVQPTVEPAIRRVPHEMANRMQPTVETAIRRVPHEMANRMQPTVETAIRRVPHQLANRMQPTAETAIRRVPHQLANRMQPTAETAIRQITDASRHYATIISILPSRRINPTPIRMLMCK